jgi:PAS domain S-box-containing protein
VGDAGFSPRKESEEAAERLAAIIASSSDGIIGKTLAGIITSWNAAAERIFGYTAEEIVGRPIFPMIPEELLEAEQALLDRIRRGERAEFADTVRIRKDGRRSTSPSRSRPSGMPGVVIGACPSRGHHRPQARGRGAGRREERYRALVTATTPSCGRRP